MPPTAPTFSSAAAQPEAAAYSGLLHHHQHDAIIGGASASFSSTVVDVKAAAWRNDTSYRRRSPFAEATPCGGDSSSSAASYASSMDNISRLLNGFMKSSPPPPAAAAHDVKPAIIVEEVEDPFLSFDQHFSGATDLAFAGVPPPPLPALLTGGVHASYGEETTRQQQQAPLCSIEKWLLDEAVEQVADLMDDLSDGCCSLPLLY